MNTPTIVSLAVADLKPYPTNARTHKKSQLKQIAKSIETFGFTNPVLVDDTNTIIAGHGRVEAAKMLGLATVPTIRLDHLTPEQVKAYVIADNRLAEKAGWDKEILALELQHLMELDLSFEVDVTGFSLPEIDLMLQAPADKKADKADEVPEVAAVAATQLGDLWQLGEHRVYCGSALEATSYKILLGAKKAQLVFTDPPYNVPIQGHVSGLGKVKHREFAMATGEMDASGFIHFLRTFMQQATKASKDGAIHYICMDWRHLPEILAAAEGVYSEFKNLCVWNKNNAGMGALYRSKHELVLVFKHGTGKHINNVELGKNGRYRTNVWDYAGVNTFGAGRSEELALHPTVKPVQLVQDALLDCSQRGGVVLDPFGGSGSTLIAAERTGREAYLMELDPLYVDVIICRWQAFTGGEAIHVASGLTFFARKQAQQAAASTVAEVAHG
ncbi:MAG: site-specific DNA-methyltransferase [Bacteroidetes bacterium]|nr:site-specific DNA-methyltransferase [Bacteroidota bacterium]